GGARRRRRRGRPGRRRGCGGRGRGGAGRGGGGARRGPFPGLVDRGHRERVRRAVGQVLHGRAGTRDPGHPLAALVDVVAGDGRAAGGLGRLPRQRDLAVTRARGQPVRRSGLGDRGGRRGGGGARRGPFPGLVDRGHRERVRRAVGQVLHGRAGARDRGRLAAALVDVVAAYRRAAVRGGRLPRQADLGIARGRGQPAGRSRRGDRRYRGGRGRG